MKIISTFSDGVYTHEQLKNLKHLEQFAPNWFWCASSDKAPRDPHKQGCKPGYVDNSETAGTLDQALQAMQDQLGSCVGVLVSAGGPGLVGIDVDNVIFDGEVHPIGLEVIKQFSEAYVEVSPSGTGLRIFCTGYKPDSAPKGSTAIGQTHHGKEIKFEIYASGGKGRFLRVTGELVESTAGLVAPCQLGIDWFCGVLAQVTANKVTSASTNPDKVNSISLDAVFGELAVLRPELEFEELEVALKGRAGRQPRGHWAEVYRGCLTQWHNDHSDAANFLCCEVIRAGAGHSDDVVGIWEQSGLVEHDKQEKFRKRPAWVLEVIDWAARRVLVELQGKATKGGQPAPAIELPQAVVESLEKTGDTLTRTRRERIEPTEGNVVVVLRNDPRVKGLLGFNELAQRAVRLGSFQVFDRGACGNTGPLSDDDVTRVAMWLAIEYKMNMDHRCLMRGIEAAALDAKFDPLADSLLALGKQWDGVPRVDTWLKQFALVDDTGCAEYVSMAGRCFMVGAVARALDPGCQVDTVLSIEGAGGGGKSSMFKVLADAVGKGLTVNLFSR